MRQARRGTYVWMGVIGAVIGVTALATLAEAPVLSVLMVGAYMAMLAAIFANDRLRQLQNVIPTLAVTTKTTTAARNAVARARRLSSYATDEAVTDIGMIVNEKDRNGRWTRRIAQSVSMDDQAVQPFVKVSVPPDQSNRVALIKFEVVDKAGKIQFSREVEQYVRDGENLIPSDQQLPIRGNDKLGRAGTWDLQVSINGALAACHSFSVTPSTAVMRSKLDDDGEAAVAHLSTPQEDDDDMPLSLEDLLREQRQESRRG